MGGKNEQFLSTAWGLLYLLDINIFLLLKKLCYQIFQLTFFLKGETVGENPSTIFIYK
jgi:hypothetical protein